MLFNPIVIFFCLSTTFINYIYNTMFIYLLLVFFIIIYFFDDSNLLDDSYLESVESLENQKLDIFYLELLHLLCYLKGIHIVHSKIEVYFFFRKTFVNYVQLLISFSNYLNGLYDTVLTISFFHIYIYPLLPYNISKYHYLYNTDSWSYTINQYKNTNFESIWELSDRCSRIDKSKYEVSELSNNETDILIDDSFDTANVPVDSVKNTLDENNNYNGESDILTDDISNTDYNSKHLDLWSDEVFLEKKMAAINTWLEQNKDISARDFSNKDYKNSYADEWDKELVLLPPEIQILVRDDNEEKNKLLDQYILEYEKKFKN